MELWLPILLSLLFSLALGLLLANNKRGRLPPSPQAIPLLGNLFWLRGANLKIDPILRDLHKKHGPMVTLHIGSRPHIFISDRNIAHKALIEHGAIFSDRPPVVPATSFFSSDQHDITSSAYGPLWRLLRRNLVHEILHPSRVKLYSPGRKWVLRILTHNLRADGTVAPMESFKFAMFCLLVLMCFGEKLDEKAIREIASAQHNLLVYFQNLNVFSFFPSITKHIFRNRLKTLSELRHKQMMLYLPLINTRRVHKSKQLQASTEERFVYSYLDSLLDIKLPEEGGRSLTEDEMVNLCSEFLTGGTDSTSSVLQWIMAEVVKNQKIQKKILEEIESVVGKDAEITQEDLEKMPYLKAVIMEGLRRHPPSHFVLPHTVTKEVEFEGYVIPRNTTINFEVAEIALDGKVWEEPMEFKPERFLKGGSGEGVDITGSKEIKMMPFGVGRRICPGLGLAMLHLEYFVANLVREFEWEVKEGEEVDLTETQEFNHVMKCPLRAHLTPRRNC